MVTAPPFTVGSLFSGIGGLDLGLERAGMSVRWQSEVDSFCCRILAHRWPDVPNLGDITSVEWPDIERVDLICGGYPCQPFSTAGNRRGEHDPRHLWPHFASALRHLRPRYALLENVTGHLSLGFGRVLADLAALGYDAEWDCIPAAAVGAPHLRYRVFVVAYAQSFFEPGRPQEPDAVRIPSAGAGGRASDGDSAEGISGLGRGAGSGAALAAGPDSARCAEQQGCAGPSGRPEPGWADALRRVRMVDAALADSASDGRSSSDAGITAGDGAPGGLSACGPDRRDDADPDSVRREGCGISDLERRASPDAYGIRQRVFGRRPQLSSQWETEPDVGRVADGVPARVDRLHALGNAVVPQVAEYIGRRLLEVARAE